MFFLSLSLHVNDDNKDKQNKKSEQSAFSSALALPNRTFVHATVALPCLTVEDAIELIKIRRWTQNSAKIKRTVRLGRCEQRYLPELTRRMNTSEDAVHCGGIGHFRTPHLGVVDEKHLFGRIFAQTRQFFLGFSSRSKPFLIGLKNGIDWLVE